MLVICPLCEEVKPVEARGLCKRCYYGAQRLGILDRFPCRRWGRRTIVFDAAYHREWRRRRKEQGHAS